VTRALRLLLLAGLLLGVTGCAHAGAAGAQGAAEAARPALKDAQRGAADHAPSATGRAARALDRTAPVRLRPVAPKAGEGVVHLVCSPASAEVVVDGVPFGYVSDYATPPYLKLKPGEHHILLRKRGFEPYRTEVYLSGSVIETLNVSLARRTPPVAGDRRESKP